jgi:hypothetical protein
MSDESLAGGSVELPPPEGEAKKSGESPAARDSAKKKSLPAKYELLVRDLVNKKLSWYATIFGVPNIAVLVGVVWYAYFAIPAIATKTAIDAYSTMFTQSQQLVNSLANSSSKRLAELSDGLAISSGSLTRFNKSLEDNQNTVLNRLARFQEE